MNNETIAETLYTRYCTEVGGKAFNGDPLPEWVDFAKDPSKSKQAQAWRAIAGYVWEVCNALDGFQKLDEDPNSFSDSDVQLLYSEAASALEHFKDDAVEDFAEDRTHLLCHYIVWLRDEEVLAPFMFKCEAEDAEHAREQAENAYPDANIMSVGTAEEE